MVSFMFINTSVLICLLVFITEIKNVYTADAAGSDDKIAAKLFESLSTNTSSKVPCYLLSRPMDRIKSALKDLEIYNELYCTRNSHLQPEALNGGSAGDAQIVEDVLPNSEYPNGPENINHDPQSDGQRTMLYPSNYNRWINPPNSYPNNFIYPYNDPSYQSAVYFYPNRMPYMNIYPVSSPSSQPPSPQAPPFIAESFDDVTTEIASSSSGTTVLGELALRRSKKSDRRCSKKKLSKKLGLGHKKDADNSNSNDNGSDSSSSE